MEERHYLNVPFKEKDAAKALGNSESLCWWVRPEVDLAVFAKWDLLPGMSRPHRPGSTAHRAVAAFAPNPNPLKEICHGD